VQDVLNTAKAKPGALNFASAGVGSGTHLNLEKLKLMAKVNMNHVPYKGSAEALADVLGSRVDFYFAPVSTTLGHLQAGKVRAIAVSTIKRSSILPNVPTIAESGVPGFDFSLWFGIWAPTGVPQPILSKVAASIKEAGNDPAIKSKLAGLGNEPMEMTPAQFAKFVRSEIEVGATVLKAAGIKPQ
jgi:tripartite-type tricarboxylate transporter receptor subunit TctC